MMFKHRDTDCLDNRIAYFQGDKYAFIGLMNAPTLDGEVWSGVNEAGFCIMNTASYNLREDTLQCQMDREGELHAGTSKSSSLPAYGRTTLSRVRSQHLTHRLLGKSGHVGPVRDGVLGQAGQRAGGERERCSTLPSPLILLCPLQLQSTDFSPSGSEAESPGERQG